MESSGFALGTELKEKLYRIGALLFDTLSHQVNSPLTKTRIGRHRIDCLLTQQLVLSDKMLKSHVFCRFDIVSHSVVPVFPLDNKTQPFACKVRLTMYTDTFTGIGNITSIDYSQLIGLLSSKSSLKKRKLSGALHFFA